MPAPQSGFFTLLNCIQNLNVWFKKWKGKKKAVDVLLPIELRLVNVAGVSVEAAGDGGGLAAL